MDMTRLWTLFFVLMTSCISVQACLSGEPKVDMCVSNSQTVAGGVYVDTSLFTGSQCDCQFITRNASSLIVEMTKAPFLPTCGTDISVTYGGETVNKTCGSISANIFPVTDDTGVITISKVGTTISREDLCVLLEPVGDAEISIVCSDSTDYLSTTVENFRTSVSEVQTSTVPHTTEASSTPTIIPIDLTTSSLDMSIPLKDIVTDGFPRETITDKLSEPTPYIEPFNTKITNKTLREEIDPYAEPPNTIKDQILKKAKNSENPVFIENWLSPIQKTTVASGTMVADDAGLTSRGLDLTSDTSISPFTAASEPPEDIKNKILNAANNSNNPILIESTLSTMSTHDTSEAETKVTGTSEFRTTSALETSTNNPSEPPTSIKNFILARANNTDNPISFETSTNYDSMKYTTTPKTVTTDSELTTSTDMTSSTHAISKAETEVVSTSEIRTTPVMETTTNVHSEPPSSTKNLILALANDTDNPINFETSTNYDSMQYTTTPSTLTTDSELTTSSDRFSSTHDISEAQTEVASTSEVSTPEVRTTPAIETTTDIPSEPPSSIKKLILARANDTDNPINFETAINNDIMEYTTTPSTVTTDSELTTSSSDLSSSTHDISKVQTEVVSTTEVRTTTAMETTTSVPSEPPSSIKKLILARANDTDNPINFETSTNNNSLEYTTTPSTTSINSETTHHPTDSSTSIDSETTIEPVTFSEKKSTTIVEYETSKTTEAFPTSTATTATEIVSQTTVTAIEENKSTHTSLTSTAGTASEDISTTFKTEPTTNDFHSTFSPASTSVVSDIEITSTSETATLIERSTSTMSSTTETLSTTTNVPITTKESTMPSSTTPIVSKEPTMPSSTTQIVSRESSMPSSTTQIVSRESSMPSSTTQIVSRESSMPSSTTPIVGAMETSTLMSDVHSTTELSTPSSTAAPTSSDQTIQSTEVPHSTTTESTANLIGDQTLSSSTQTYTTSTAENMKTTTGVYKTSTNGFHESTEFKTTKASPVATTTTLSSIMDSTTDAFFKWAFGNSKLTDEFFRNEQTTTASKSTAEKAEPTTEKTEISSVSTTTEKFTTATANETTKMHIISTSSVVKLSSDSTVLSHTTKSRDMHTKEPIVNSNMIITDKPRIQSTTSKTVDKGIKGTHNGTEEENPLLGQDTLVVILVGVIIGIIVVIAIIAMLTSFVKSRRRSANITVMEKGNMELYGSGIDNPLVQLEQQDQMVEINPDPEPSSSAPDFETSNGNIGSNSKDEVINLNEMDSNGITSQNNGLANGNSSKLGDVKSEDTNSSL